MNTGISRRSLRILTALGLCGALAGCNAAQGFSFAAAGKDDAAQGTQIGAAIPKLASAELARGAVNVTAPKGYCIDQTSIVSGLGGSSATLAPCSALDGKGASREMSAVMTVSVSPRRPSPAPAPTSADLAAAVAPAEVLSAQTKGQLALVHVATGGDALFQPADPKHWRAATSLDSRLVLLSLYAPADAPLAADAGAALLSQLARGIKATRSGGLLGLRAPAPEAQDGQDALATQETLAPAGTQPEAEAAQQKGLKRVFGRLFNRS